jgi:hypothetical protein
MEPGKRLYTMIATACLKSKEWEHTMTGLAPPWKVLQRKEPSLLL